MFRPAACRGSKGIQRFPEPGLGFPWGPAGWFMEEPWIPHGKIHGKIPWIGERWGKGTSVFSGFRVGKMGKYSTRLLESSVAIENPLEMDGI